MDKTTVGSPHVATDSTPTRKYPRASFHDYNCGSYFVTVCTRGKIHYLGEISDSVMVLSELGLELQRSLLGIAEHYPDVEIPLFTIMPNHFHAIISIRDNDDNGSYNCGRLNKTARIAVATGGDPTTATHHNCRLGVVVGGIKASVTRYARRRGMAFAWQARYHDHIVRNAGDGNLISDYIRDNVARWAMDCYNM